MCRWSSTSFEQDVQVVEHVLVQQMGLIEQEDGMAALLAEVLAVRADRKEETRGGRFGR